MKYIVLSLFLIINFTAFGQTIVKGTVTEARTKKPIQFVSVSFNGSTTGTITDAEGKYSLRTTREFLQLKITFIGFKQVIRTVLPGKTQVIDFQLEEEERSLSEVT